MIDALVGSVIAVVATGALVLMIESMNASSSPGSRRLNSYNSSVVDRVARKRGLLDVGGLEDRVADWLNDQASLERTVE